MHTSVSLGDFPGHGKSEQAHSERCAEQQCDEDRSVDELKNKSKTRALRSLAAYQGTVSFGSVREAKVAALVETPDDSVHEKALRVVGELIDVQRQPRTVGPRNRGSMPLVPLPRGGAALQDRDRRDTNTAKDARANVLRSTHGGLDDVSQSVVERPVRTATVQHLQSRISPEVLLAPT
ncbi:hypothetical protein CC86DRAFT_403406 [Ophiobolus disseminans]|uniref:Uncharacterized protein n=1 Tax=Ophiobolus disseminans TaxID=1469910 RepID=A0A6A7AA59_9PLEO|nr:hypothetical protein CC86DRAFT_403406 [Ophiobolus disseminans]